MKKKKPVIKQIILVTDGQSNTGGNPIDAAKRAFDRNIIVNTVGILDRNNQREEPIEEIVKIAKVGGGSYEYTYIEELYHTMQSLTYKTVNQTIQEAVNKQLKEIMGNGLDGMAPLERSKILNYIDSFSDEVRIRCCILMDASGSMNSKINSARYSILDLMNSFKGRKGKVDFAVIAFPGEKAQTCKTIYDFYNHEIDLERCLYEIKPKGGTPTAEAITFAVEMIENFKEDVIMELGEYTG